MATTVKPISANGAAKKPAQEVKNTKAEAPKRGRTTAKKAGESTKPASVQPQGNKKELQPLTLEEMKERINALFSLQSKYEKWNNTLSKLKELQTKNDPVQGDLKLLIKDGSSGYNDSLFNTTNQEIIGEALVYLIAKVSAHLEELKEELINAKIG